MKGKMIKCAKRWMPRERRLLKSEMKDSRGRRNRGGEKLSYFVKRGRGRMMPSRSN
jgi:hypothetical protein